MVLFVSAVTPGQALIQMTILIMVIFLLMLILLALSIIRYGYRIGKTESSIIAGILFILWSIGIALTLILRNPYVDISFVLILSTRVLPIFLCTPAGISLALLFKDTEIKMGKIASIVLLVGAVIPILPIVDIGLILLGLALRQAY